jgi:transcriptional regulator with XRE-family HTH domain
MIRNMREYNVTLERIEDFAKQIRAATDSLRQERFVDADIAVATAPVRQLLDELVWERELYDRLRTEGLAAVPSYPPGERGKALIAIRIARGLSQRELADALGVSQAQVSRDESNEYRGITNERYARVLDALGVEEQVAEYRAREPIVVQMPTVRREAAAFVADYGHCFTVTSDSEDA